MELKVKREKLKKFLFENVSFKQTIVKNALWLSVSNIAVRVIKAVMIIYVARILGVSGYGVFSYIVSLSAFFALFSDFGLTGIVTREVAKYPELENQYLSTAFFIKLVVIAISIALILFASPFFTHIPEAIPLIPLAALLLAFDSVRDFTFSITRARERMQIEAGINIFANLAITAIGIVAIFIHPTPQTLTEGYVAGSLLGTLFAFWLLRGHFTNLISAFDKTLVRKIITEAWPFALIGLLSAVMFNTDTVMLGWLRDARDVGLYSAAQRPIQLLALLPTIFTSSLFPAFARFAEEDRARFRSLFEKSLKLSLLIALPIVAGGIVLSSGIIHLLFGSEYLSSASAFSIMLLTLLFVFPSSFIAQAVFAFNEQKNFIGVLAFGAISNAVLDYILIPPYGIVGCSLATIGALSISNGYMWYKMKRIQDFHVFPHMRRAILATVIMAIGTYTLQYLGLHTLPIIFLMISLYGFTLYALKEPFLDKNAIFSILK